MRVVIALSLAALSVPPALARAEPTDAEVATRLAFIEKRLADGTPAATRWSYGWLATFGTLSVAQVGVALGTTDPGLRADTAVGAFSSSLGILPFALLPFTPRFAASELGALPEATPEERRKKLGRAETLLKKSAEIERMGHGWVPQVAGITVSVGFGLVLSLAYKRIRSGMMNTAFGVGVVEAQIASEPTDAIDDWDQYQRGNFQTARSRHRMNFAIVPSLGGIGIAGAF